MAPLWPAAQWAEKVEREKRWACPSCEKAQEIGWGRAEWWEEGEWAQEWVRM